MWWLPLSVGVGLGTVLIGLYYWHERRVNQGAGAYRARYLQLVNLLETISVGAAQLSSYVKEVDDLRLLDYYASGLKMFETLLEAVRHLPPFGTDPGSLNSAFYLAKDCQERLRRIQDSFRTLLSGRPMSLNHLYGRKGYDSPAALGCYFCSRPFRFERFSRVNVRIDGEVKEVISCNVCKEELLHTKKIKVLYFVKDGQPVHWTQWTDYVPSSDYWNINKHHAVEQTRQLELVYSRTSRLSSEFEDSRE